MQASEPSTQTVTISDVKDTIVQLVDRVSRGETRIVVEEGGVPIAALVSSEDLKHLARLDEQRAERRRVVAAMREPFRGVSPEEIERETAKAVAELREEMRADREAATSQDSRQAHDLESGYHEESDMANQPPPTQTLPMSDVKSALSGLVEVVSRNETRVVIAKRGVPVAALVSADDLDRLSRWEHEREERFAVFDRMREAFADVPPEEIEREAEWSVAAARERIRQRTTEPAARSA